MRAKVNPEVLGIQSNARTWHVPDVSMAEAQRRLVQALRAEGFSVMAEIDLAEVLNRRLDLRLEPHLVIEACHPKLAERALAVASDASLLMPCKICLWKEGNGATVAVLPPTRLAEALGRPHLDEVAREADERLERALLLLDRPAALEPLPPATTEPGVALDEADRVVLRDAAASRARQLLVEAAGTESHDMQHELARTIDQIEAAIRKLDAGSASPRATTH